MITKYMDIAVDITKAKNASVELAALDSKTKNNALKAMASALDKNRKKILSANAKDCDQASKDDISNTMMNRLKLTDEKISGMIDSVNDVIKLKDPVGETMSTLELDKDLVLYQVRCPIGTIGVIFEARPEVVPQIMSLCLKSGNSVVFKGGKEATESNKTLFKILTEAAYSCGVPKGCFVLMETREDVNAILDMDDKIDLLIPRGSNEFVSYIKNNTKIPVLGHAAGICHVYFDEYADIDKGLKIAVDAKVQYPAVCNAVETIIVNSKIAIEVLPELNDMLHSKGVEIRADERAHPAMKDSVEAKESDWDAEYDDLIVAVKVLDDVDQAITFINKHSSHHTDCIVTEDKENMMKFVKKIDSADVCVNASTRFSDGYRFGKGAEVGISTNKIHSRGPVGMEGLMIYKYILIGDGHIVGDYVGKNAKKFTHKKMNKVFEE